MQRVTRLAVIALGLAGGFSTFAGCQMSGSRDSTRRTADAATQYDRAYVASRDTQWMASTDAAAPGGTIPAGTRVYFSTEPTTAPWQQARVEGRGIVYVRPTDFRRPS